MIISMVFKNLRELTQWVNKEGLTKDNIINISCDRGIWYLVYERLQKDCKEGKVE